MKHKGIYQTLPATAWVILFILILLGTITANPLHTIVALMLVPFMIRLTWRVGEPPFLFFGLVWQWLSVVLKVLYADINGMPFNSAELHDYPDHIEEAYWLSIICIIVFTVGLHFIQKKTPVLRIEHLVQSLRPYSPVKIVLLYIFVSIILLNFSQAFFRFPGFTQFLFQVAYIKWGLFFIFFVTAFVLHKSYRLIFIIVMGIEVLLGFSGFFSQFKEYLIFFVLFFLGLNIKINYRQIVMAIPVVALAFYLGLVWMAVRWEFRMYLSGGEQTVLVTKSKTEALDKFYDLARELGPEDFDVPLRLLIDRISYIDYFSACINYIPDYLDHQNGKVFLQAVTHIFTPRLLFPNKGIVHDTDHLNKYTGLGINHLGGGSFSLGYAADAYIDFGPYGMFFPILLLGIFVGFMFKFIVKHSPNIIWAFVFAVPLYYYTNIYGKWSLKIYGQGFMYLIVLYILSRFILPPLDRWLRK